MRTAGVSPAPPRRATLVRDGRRTRLVEPRISSLGSHARTRNPPRVRDARSIIVQCHARISAGGIPPRVTRESRPPARGRAVDPATAHVRGPKRSR